MKRSGWFGNSQGHSLARKGIRLYNKSRLDATFYAMKQEMMVPYSDVVSSIRSGKTFEDLRGEHTNADPEKLRRRGIKAIEAQDADNTMTFLEENGIDVILMKFEASPNFKERVNRILDNPQRRSYLHKEKVMALQQRINA
jgi:cellulase/cellobiase CelA1